MLFSLATAVMAASLVPFAHAASVPASRGMLHGIVTDPSGAVIPAATVTVASRHFSETISTDANGQFAIAGLTPDHYRVEVRAAGFSAFHRSGFVVSSGRETEADAQLPISLPKQEITVTD